MHFLQENLSLSMLYILCLPQNGEVKKPIEYIECGEFIGNLEKTK